MDRRLISIFATLLISSVVPASAGNVWKTTEDLPKYAPVAPGLFRGGQPSVVGLKTLSQSGIKTIISFRNNKALTEAETAEAKKLNLNFYSLPLSGTRAPSSAVIKKFLDIATDPAAQPVFVHCEEGVDRTGTMVGIYRIETDHWTADKAYEEMLQHGFHPRYPWLADAVFDFAHKKGLAGKGRPLAVKIFDSVEGVFGFLRV